MLRTTAQCVTSLLYKHEDRSSNPHNLGESQIVMAFSINVRVCGSVQREADPEVSWPASLARLQVN